MLRVPSEIQEKIALWGFPHELYLVNRWFRDAFSGFSFFWTLQLKEIAKHQDVNVHHSFYLAQYQTFWKKKILVLGKERQKEKKLLRVWFLPPCSLCQERILCFLSQQQVPVPYHIQHVQIESQYLPFLEHLMVQNPSVQIHFTGQIINTRVEKLALQWSSRFGSRIHFGSLLFRVAASGLTSEFRIVDSLLWPLWDQERIDVFSDSIPLENALSYAQTWLCLQPKYSIQIPLVAWHEMFEKFIQEDHLWPSPWKLFPIVELMHSLHRDSHRQAELLHLVFTNSFSFPHRRDHLLGLLDNFVQASQLPTVYDLFQLHLETTPRVCEPCQRWLLGEDDKKKTNRKRKVHFSAARVCCLVCILRRHLTFENRESLYILFQTYGFPEELLSHAFQQVGTSRVLRQRLMEILRVCLADKNTQNLLHVLQTCKVFEMDPATLVYENGTLLYLPLLVETSGGCLATLLGEFPEEDQIQCLQEIALYKTDTTKSIDRAPIYRRDRTISPYTRFPHCLLFG